MRGGETDLTVGDRSLVSTLDVKAFVRKYSKVLLQVEAPLFVQFQ